MNYNWRQIAERGQYATGFVDVYELEGKKKAIAVIHYLPQFEQKKQRVLFTLILEGKKGDWTDGTISNIFEDAEGRIKNAEYFKFNNFNSLEYVDTQIFNIKSIDEFDYVNHGDYTFIDTKK